MRVPRYDGPQVESTNLRGNYSDGGVSAKTFGADIAEGLGNVGRAMGQIAQQEREKVDTSQLMELENQIVANKAAFLTDPDKGAVNRQGRDAVGMTSKLLPEWEKNGSALVFKLPARLKAQGKQLLLKHTEGVRQNLMAWEVQKGDQFHADQADAGIALATEEAVGNRLNPAGVDAAVDRALTYSSMEMRRRGADDMMQAVGRKKVASSIYRKTVESLIGEDISAAEDRLTNWRSYLTADDQLAIAQQLQPAADDQIGYAIGQELLNGRVPTVPGGDFDGEVTKIAPSDALGKMPAAQRVALRYDDPALNGYAAYVEQRYGLPPGLLNAIKNAGEKSNSTQTSPKGAQGVMQFMPDSLKAYGVTDASDPALMIDAAGRYMKDHLKHYGGDVAATVAHYNDGGKAGAAVAKGGKPPAAETQQYLQRVMGALGGKESPVTRIEMNADTPPEVLISMIPRNLTRSQRQSAENVIKDSFAAKNAQRTMREQSASRSIYDKVTKAAPGRPLSKILTPDELVEYGQNAELAASIGRYRNALTSGEVIEDNAVVVDELYRLQATNPTGFRQTNLNRYSDTLSGKTLLSLQKAQDEMNKPEKVAQFASEADLVKQEFDKLGIADDSDTEADETQIARGQYLSSFTLAKEAFIKKNDRLPDAAEMRTLLRELTYTSARKRGTYDTSSEFSKKNKDRPLFQKLSRWSDANTVPNDERDKIIKALQKEGIAEPTEIQIQGAFAEQHAGASQ